jgi:hypothetical protein
MSGSRVQGRILTFGKGLWFKEWQEKIESEAEKFKRL